MPSRNFIQWKGTDVCVDLECECGAYIHFDGLFLYAWRCPRCGAVWVMESTVQMQKDNDFDGVIIDDLQEDEDVE
jgi:hypothetical protein